MLGLGALLVVGASSVLGCGDEMKRSQRRSDRRNKQLKRRGDNWVPKKDED